MCYIVINALYKIINDPGTNRIVHMVSMYTLIMNLYDF